MVMAAIPTPKHDLRETKRGAEFMGLDKTEVTRPGPCDRHVRDMQSACQHVVGQPKPLEGVGSSLLGREPGCSRG